MIFKFIKKVLGDSGKTLGEFLFGFGFGIFFAVVGVAFLAVIGFLFQWIPGIDPIFPEGKSRLPGYITIGFALIIVVVVGHGAISYLRTTWKEMKRK